MLKVTPDPPNTDSCPNPAAHIMVTPHKPSTLFTINPDINTETLLAHACESLASASVMANDLRVFWKARTATPCWASRKSSCWGSWR
jgi:hypothetical protein